MAVNRTIARFLAHGLATGAIPPGGELLEIGESVVAANNTAYELIEVVEPHIPKERAEEARRRVAASVQNKAVYQNSFGPARAFFHAVFEPRLYAAVELGLSPRKIVLDLNRTQNLTRRFDCVVNNGTSEHIFDQARVYEFIHRVTRPGGIMIHWTPGLGFENHGLFNAQPGFFFDLAHANGYEVKIVGLIGYEAYEPISCGDDYKRAIQTERSSRHSLLGAILGKVTDSTFQAPIQSDYQGGLAAAYRLSKVPRHIEVDGRKNLALGKPAMQSSTSRYSYDSDPALDAAGGNNGIITGFYCFSTELEMEPWWMVDLGEVTQIREVVVYNPLPASGDLAKRSSKLRIKLSTDGQDWSIAFARNDEVPIGGADGHPLRVPLTAQAARFVRIDLPGRSALHLDEIEVY